MTFLVLVILTLLQAPALSVKEMFYNPAGAETVRPPIYFPGETRRLREVNLLRPFRHCGIHYWFEDSQGVSFDENSARLRGGRFSLFVRSNCGGFLTLFDLNSPKPELTPRSTEGYSGFRLGGGDVFRVPGNVELGPTPTKRLIIVWARSQTEVARNADDAPNRLRRMSQSTADGWQVISHLADATTAGEIGNYVVNHADAGVAAEVKFSAR